MNRWIVGLTLGVVLMALAILAVVGKRNDSDSVQAPSGDSPISTVLPSGEQFPASLQPTSSQPARTLKPVEAHPGVIGGRLFNKDGSVGSGIEITAQLFPTNAVDFDIRELSPSVHALPDERGVFHIEKLPFGNYTVLAEAEGQIARATCRLNRETPVADVLLILQDPDGIFGRVVDSDGAGVSSAVVFPLLQDGKERQTSAVLADSTLTDEMGNFALPYLEAGTWTLHARAQGFAPTISGPIATGTQDALVQLDRGVPVAGHATEGGMPVDDVKVTLADAGLNTPEMAARTDDQGAFTFDAVGPGKYELRGEKAGRIVKNAPITVVVANKPQEGLVLEMVRGGVVRGRVTDGDSGAGVSGVTVKAYLEGSSRLSHTSEPSDTQGRFEVTGLNPGAYELVVHEAPGYSRFGRGQSAVKVTISPGETLEGITLVLSRGIMVSGHVIDTEGEAVMGAFVHGRVRGWQDQQTTGTDGVFTLSRLKGGESIRVWASTSSARSPEYVFDIPPTGLQGVKLVLEHAADGLIAGVVVDRRSQPFRGHISLALADKDSHQTTNRDATDDKGRFLFANVAAGNYKIGARTANGLGRELFRLTMKPGQQVRNLRLVFEDEASLEISGQVTDESGTPLAAALRLDRREKTSRVAQSMGSTAVDGTFRFNGLSEGLFAITASARGFSDVTTDDLQAGTKDVAIVLPDSLSISGYVVSSENVPVTDFEVAAIRAGSTVESAAFFRVPFMHFSNPEGSYHIVVEEGRHDVVARAPGFALGRANAGEAVAGTGIEDVIVVLAKRPMVRGRVIDGAGHPVAGAAIFLGPLPEGAEQLTGYAAVHTDPGGRFEIAAPEVDSALHLSAFHRIAGMGEVYGETGAADPVEIVLLPSESPLAQ